MSSTLSGCQPYGVMYKVLSWTKTPGPCIFQAWKHISTDTDTDTEIFVCFVLDDLSGGYLGMS
jgi:hypothetical protein